MRHQIESEADELQQYASKKGCVFAFIPPRAPHMGGLWEAGVKSAKNLLLRAVGSAKLTAEELQTVLVGVEAVLNSRPLGALSQDPSDGEALTPGHLLTGGPLIAPPAPRTPDQQGLTCCSGLTCLRRWRLVSSIKQMFWQRWSREYVLGLQARSQWQREQEDARKGDLVLVAEDDQPPQQWITARVVESHAGADGRVRVADVRTSRGALFRRAVHKLARLPIV
ncbi:hypothetical protein KR067_006779, partial [Drosophila pandora]